jgi:hypothetical protein
MSWKKTKIAGAAALFLTAASAGGVYVAEPYFTDHDRAEEAYNGTSLLPASLQISISERFAHQANLIGGSPMSVIQYYARDGDADALVNYVAGISDETRTRLEETWSNINNDPDTDYYTKKRLKEPVWNELDEYFVHPSNFGYAMQRLIKDDALATEDFETAANTLLVGYSAYLQADVLIQTSEGDPLGVMISAIEDDFNEWAALVRDVRGNEDVAQLFEDNIALIQKVIEETGESCNNGMCWLSGRFTQDLKYSL